MATIEPFPSRPGSAAPAAPATRRPPANVEAEQALLGAILINNDAYDRVSDFLRVEHFVEEIHRRIFENAGHLIRAGKLASPITLKTFLGEHDLGGGLTVPQYLARLVAEATTVRCRRVGVDRLRPLADEGRDGGEVRLVEAAQ